MKDDSTRTASGAVDEECKVDGIFPKVLHRNEQRHLNASA